MESSGVNWISKILEFKDYDDFDAIGLADFILQQLAAAREECCKAQCHWCRTIGKPEWSGGDDGYFEHWIEDDTDVEHGGEFRTCDADLIRRLANRQPGEVGSNG